MYRSPLNIWHVSRSSFVSSFLHFAGAPLNYGNTKGKAFWTFCAPAGAVGAPSLPTPALWLRVCCVIRCDTKTSLSSSLCQPAALHWKPALTAMTLQPDWTSDPLTPSHSDGAQIHHYYMYADLWTTVLMISHCRKGLSFCFCPCVRFWSGPLTQMCRSIFFLQLFSVV